MNRKRIISLPIAIVILVAAGCGCGNKTPLIVRFHAEAGTDLTIPVKHSRGLYPNTEIYFNFNPAISNHPSRDFSDVVFVAAFDAKGATIDVSRVYDVNGLGRDIEVDFKNPKPDIVKAQVIFKTKCSGSMDILSWQPK